MYRRHAETPVPWESAGGVEPDRRVCSTSEEACLAPIICLSRGSSLHSAPFLRGGALHFNGLPHLASTSTVQVAALHCDCAGPGLSVPERRSVRAERPEHPEGVPAAATVRVVHTTGRLIDAVRVMCRVALSQTSRPVNDLAADRQRLAAGRANAGPLLYSRLISMPTRRKAAGGRYTAYGVSGLGTCRVRREARDGWKGDVRAGWAPPSSPPDK